MKEVVSIQNVMTGDNSNMTLYIVLAIIAVGVIVGMAIYSKKRNK